MKQSAHIENLTEFPTREIRKIALWVLRELDVNIPSLVVRFKPSKGHMHSGRFYPHARKSYVIVWRGDRGRAISPKIPDDAEHLIIARVPRHPVGAANRIKRGGPPMYGPGNWQEAAVCITAHEAQHVRQHLFPREDRPRWSEVEAEWAEYRLLKRWRERKTK